MLSVVIPTRMRPETVVRTLGSLARQDLDPEAFEVVVVVDGCRAGTAERVRAASQPYAVTVVEQQQGGLAAARNRGAAAARGDHLLFCDDDMVLSVGFLRTVDEALTAGADVALTEIRVGDWVPHSVTTAEARRWDAETHGALLADDVVFDHIHFAATGIRSSVFERAGGFDAAFTAGGAYGNEDIELGHRLLGLGAVVRYAHGAVADTDACTDPDDLMRRMVDVGRNDVRLARKHPELTGALFGRKFANSTIYRVTGTVVLTAPWISATDLPLRAVFRRIVRRGRCGPISYRVWFAVRAIRYWEGVARAGGRELVSQGRAMSAPAADQRAEDTGFRH